MQHYRKKTIMFLIGYLMIFIAVFFWSYLSLKAGIPIIQIGLGYNLIDGIGIALSSLSILYAIFEIIKVEHSKEYEDKIRMQVK